MPEGRPIILLVALSLDLCRGNNTATLGGNDLIYDSITNM